MLDTIRRKWLTEDVLARVKVNLLLTIVRRVGGGEPTGALQQCVCARACVCVCVCVWTRCRREERLRKVQHVHVYLHCELWILLQSLWINMCWNVNIFDYTNGHRGHPSLWIAAVCLYVGKDEKAWHQRCSSLSVLRWVFIKTIAKCMSRYKKLRHDVITDRRNDCPQQC